MTPAEIRNLRKCFFGSQANLAKKALVAQSTISAIEDGKQVTAIYYQAVVRLLREAEHQYKSSKQQIRQKKAADEISA